MYRPFQRDKEKNEFPNSRRAHTIMSPEDMASGKKSYWPELEITGIVCNISPALWQLRHLTSLYLNDNSLTHIPPDIANLSHLTHLDVSSNKLRILPPELGDLVSLKELLLNNNFLRNLPCELGRLFRLHNLGLKGNPLCPELFVIYSDSNGTQKLLSYLLDNLSVPSTDPPERPWVNVNQPCRTRPVCDFTVMCYNVLCDKYATRQMYGYCPSWALSWEYRRKGIMNEIRRYSADIISLQEVETEQFYNFFLPELQREGYGGIFSPKSRAKTMSEGERKHVDGCAIFYRTTKFTLIKEYLVEFNQLAMANAEGSDDMLNRVMTKDNIGLAGLFQIKEGAYQNGLQPEVSHGQPILVCTAHIHWDPEFCDVKLIQTMMLMHELRGIAEEAHTIFYPNSQKLDVNNIPLMLCGDFNSLPESGVIEFLSTGRVSGSHPDFKELGYKESLRKFSYSDATNEYNHPFRVSRTYNDDGLMPYTNYTCDFKGIIDYVFFSKRHITELGVLGPLDTEWMNLNKIAGCPHPHIPSDHFPLLVELELSLSAPSNLIIPNDLMLQR